MNTTCQIFIQILKFAQKLINAVIYKILLNLLIIFSNVYQSKKAQNVSFQSAYVPIIGRLYSKPNYRLWLTTCFIFNQKP